MYFENSLKALKKQNRFRTRDLIDENLIDFSSNDYLGLAENQDTPKKAFQKIESYKTKSPKSSMLVNGYHPIHKEFEEYISQKYGFEKSIVVGSGYLANIALIESLARRDDLLIIDEKYHASGIMASKLSPAKVLKLRHNDTSHLKNILQSNSYQKAIIAVEGIYSMDGDLLNKEIIQIADDFNALLIVDEAHSIGVVGKNFGGIFDEIKPNQNHIKMGTLGKALGSYGAYISASKEIITYLENRAKPIIYSTAPSLFDIALAHENFKYIDKNLEYFSKKRDEIKKTIKEMMNINIDGLILKIPIKDNETCLKIKEVLLSKGFSIGAIRPPTVESPILRIIPRLNISKDKLITLLKELL